MSSPPPLEWTPTTSQMSRYFMLNERDMARVTITALRRMGKLEPGMKPRRLTRDEAEQLTDEDFD